MTVKCPLCGQKFDRFMHLDFHLWGYHKLRQHNNDLDTWNWCSCCGEKCRTPEEMDRHYAGLMNLEAHVMAGATAKAFAESK